MPLSTGFSTSPYFDDYNQDNEYYKILFKPGVSVQVRELNQLQTMLQAQIEKFGDNIFKRGTIIDGCGITFNSNFPYVKILDNETDGTPVNVAQYVGYNVKNQANITPLVASITTVVSGYVSQSPDLNTIYVRYVNSGSANVAGVPTEIQTFAANDVLTVYNPKNIIENVNIVTSSSGFSNTDNVIFTSALAVQNTTGGTFFANTFNVGDYVTDGTANAQITAIDAVTNSAALILNITPRATDLKAGNSYSWTFSSNTNIQTTNATPSSVASIAGIIGSGAQGSLVTGSLGQVQYIAITNKGTGYYSLPTVSIASSVATTGQISTANLVAQNYLTSVQIANNNMNPIGSGYAMSVGDGVVYQKGYFAKVDENLVIVSKYDTMPDSLSVGFNTAENIVTYNQDPSLLDNATGAPNTSAPGADRLSLSPKLVVVPSNVADANSDFLSIVKFSAGNPYEQNRQTAYNVIGNEMARRTYEEAGNFVIDQFQLNTKSPNSFSNENTEFDILIDPGKAYIQGNRVETDFNYQTGVRKGIDSVVANNATISLNYGNYILVNQLGGVFMFKTGDVIQLYTNPGTYISSGAAAAPIASGLGTLLGTARMRSMILDSGIPGTSSAVYRIYLFDIQLATAHNIVLTKSVFYNGTNTGIADVVLNNGQCQLYDNNDSAMIFYAGNPAVKNANNISYVYRTFANNMTLAANGIISWTTAGGETFPYTGTLSSSQESDLIIIPLANTKMSSNVSGQISCNVTSTQVNGVATAFTTDLQAGDFIQIADSANTIIAQVNNVINNTAMFVVNNPSKPVLSGNGSIYFPANVPISLARSNRTANVDITAVTFKVNVGGALSSSAPVAVAYNVKSSNTTPVSKTVNRNAFVRINTANNVAGTLGPWAMGVPDVFRLKGVYLGANNTFAPTDAGVTDITSSFYIDHNQTADFYDISYLYLTPTTAQTLTTSNVLLVEYDCFTDSGTGLKGPGNSGSYPINDLLTLTASTSTLNTLEIPEMFDTKGNYYDMRDQFDLRPRVANTVAVTTLASAAPINPTQPALATKYDSTDKKFPAPNSSLNCNIEYYVGRTSRVTVDAQGNLNVIDGTPGSNVAPVQPSDAMTINILSIPPYPTVPFQMSNTTISFLDTKVINEKYSTERLSNYRVATSLDANTITTYQPKGYTMTDIGSLENRISALEYYTSYTLVETLTQKLTIPSSVDPTVDRFKFGYYVDNFADYTYADITNPSYNATILDGFLSPHTEEMMLSAQSQSPMTILPYTEAMFISQTTATNGPVTPIVANTASTNSTTGTVTPANAVVYAGTETPQQSTVAIVQNNRTLAYSDAGLVYEDFFYNMSSKAGAVSFYMVCEGGATAMEFSQSSSSNGPWVATQSSASSSPLTTSDIINYGLGALNIYGPTWGVNGSGYWPKYGPVPYGGFVRDHFKVLFNYDPTQGSYVRIRIWKGSIKHSFPGSGTYEFKMYYPIDSSINAINVMPTTMYSIGYPGKFWFDTQFRFTPIYTWTYPLGYTLPNIAYVTPGCTPYLNNTYIMADQAVSVGVTGLKPLTTHAVTINGVDVGSITKPSTGLLGAAVVTDANGQANVAVYYGATNSKLVSSVQKAAFDIIKQAGTKTLVFTSTDGSSVATGTLQVPDYISTAVAAPVKNINISSLATFL